MDVTAALVAPADVTGGPGPCDDLVARLLDLAAGWVDLPRAVRHDVGRVDLIRALEVVKAAAAAAQAGLAADLDASQRQEQAAMGVPAAERGRGVGAQVALARRDSPHRGGRHLGLAKALVHEMPHTLAALQAGRVSEWRATVLVRETAVLTAADRSAVDAELAGDEDRLQVLEQLGDRALAARVKQVAYRLDPRSVVERSRRAEGERCVTVRPAPDTMAYLTALLPARDAIAAHASLGRAAEAARNHGDPRGRGQLMADVLVDRLTSAADLSVVGAGGSAGGGAGGSAGGGASGGGRSGRSGAGAGAGPEARGGPGAAAPGAAAAASTGAGAGPAVAATPGGWAAAIAATTWDATGPDGAARTPAPPSSPRTRPGDVAVRLVMTDRSLLDGDDEPAHLDGYGSVPAGWARRLVVDALDRAGTGTETDSGTGTGTGTGTATGTGTGTRSDTGTGPPHQVTAQQREARVFVTRLITDRFGALAAMESRARTAPRGLADLIRTRDGGTCRTPWCDAPARHVDHVVPHAAGGPTGDRNLQGLCERCNYTRQAPGWQATTLAAPVDRAGPEAPRRHTVTTTTPTGHTYVSVAPPLPGAPPGLDPPGPSACADGFGTSGASVPYTPPSWVEGWLRQHLATAA